MGSSSESIRYLLQQLQCRPHAITWSPPQPLIIHRGVNNKLGFHFKTVANEAETVTVVVLVKADCLINTGSLQVGDRIVSINNVCVTRLNETEVKHVFSQMQDSAVHMLVSAMNKADANTQIKRILSVNSSASSNSVTASVDSGEHPQVKRFQKSSSTETPSPASPCSCLGSPVCGLVLHPIESASHSVHCVQRPLVEVVSHPADCVQRELVSHSADCVQRELVSHPADCVQRELVSHPAGCVQRELVSHPAGCVQRELASHPAGCVQREPASHPAGCVQRPVLDTPPPRLQPSPPRRGVDCKVRSYLYHSPHIKIINNTNSLPARMEDDIVLPDDIELCEADGPSSLPPVLTPLPNTPTPSLNHHPPGGAFINTCIGGASSVSGETVGTAVYHRSLGVEVCRAPGCGVQKMCLWHKFVLTYPQYVIWEAFTKTVMLEKSNHSSFGFKYKVKKYDGPPAEVFALVTEVTSGGVAWFLLLPGDWIRSINGTPVNTAKEAFRPDFRNLSSLRLVIQRPEGLSPKGINKLKQLAYSMRVSLYIPPPMPADSSSSPQSLLPPSSVRPASASQSCRGSEQMIFPLKAGMDVGSGSCTSRDPKTQYAVMCDPSLDQYPRQTQSPGEHIPLSTLTRPLIQRSPSTWDRCVLPQARIVVCGAHGSATDLARGLLGENSDVDLDLEANVQSLRLSLHRSVDKGVYVHSQAVPLVSVMKECKSSACGARACAQECEGGLRCMNIELYVINDEKFFHHCSSWLIPSCSLILLTFHTHKLLNQPQVEIRRLAAMVYNLWACNNNRSIPQPQVLLYGVPSGPQRDVSAEEVQGMFYVTDSGSRLLEQDAVAVSVAVPACSKSMADTRHHLFSSCQDRLGHTPVPHCVGKVVDVLSTVSAVRVSAQEMNSLVSRAMGDGDPGVIHSVTNCLVTTGCLLACGGSPAASEAKQQEYVLPFNMMQTLSSLLIKPLLDTHTNDSRQRWFKLMATARVTRSELQDLLASEGTYLAADILEQLGIVFKFHPSSKCGRGDSGFAEDACDFVVPYFLQNGMEEEESEGQGYVLKFERYVSWQGYFDMLCKLSNLAATEELVVRSQCDSVVRHNGLRLALHWRRDSGSDTVFVAVSRLHADRETFTLQQLECLFNLVIPPGVPFRLQTVDVTSPSSNLPSLGGAGLGGTGLGGAGLQVARPTRPQAQTPQEEEETFVKPVVKAEDSSIRESGGTYRNMPLTALPWSLLNQAAIQLTVTMTTGHDWKSVAERAGKTVAEIYAYEAVKTQEVPAMSFLREWILTGTVQQFLNILDSLDRPDVRDLILNHLEEQKENS